MPQPSQISKLPPTLRAQLDRKLVKSQFTGLVAIAAWLTSKGHKIGKSALGKYSKRLKDDAAAAAAHAKRAARGEPGDLAIRLACLQAAARSTGTAPAVLQRADSYAAWVKAGGKPPRGR